MYQHGSGSEFLEFLFCGNHRHDHPFLGGWVQTNFMGIFLSSADKPRFLATKGFGEEAAGAEFHNIDQLHCFSLLCVFSIYTDALHCKGSQWVTQWVTMLDVHRPHTHYMGHNGFDNGAGQEGEGVAWFWTNALFQVVRRRPTHRCCYLFVRHCVSACLACPWTFDGLLLV